ncbi:DUF6542 domain-containing protein [Streptomyces sp. NPDC004539]|uniref:DUF6542 domain-containing protein n=1 Tax=Streptomyces sp. NPDC004539 TaxID=3154280 RepID=UPI0033A8BE3E
MHRPRAPRPPRTPAAPPQPGGPYEAGDLYEAGAPDGRDARGFRDPAAPGSRGTGTTTPRQGDDGTRRTRAPGAARGGRRGEADGMTDGTAGNRTGGVTGGTANRRAGSTAGGAANSRAGSTAGGAGGGRTGGTTGTGKPRKPGTDDFSRAALDALGLLEDTTTTPPPRTPVQNRSPGRPTPVHPPADACATPVRPSAQNRGGDRVGPPVQSRTDTPRRAVPRPARKVSRRTAHPGPPKPRRAAPPPAASRYPNPRLTGLGSGLFSGTLMTALGLLVGLAGGSTTVYAVLYLPVCLLTALWTRRGDLVSAPVVLPIAFAVGILFVADGGGGFGGTLMGLVTALATQAGWLYGGTLAALVTVAVRRVWPRGAAGRRR